MKRITRCRQHLTLANLRRPDSSFSAGNPPSGCELASSIFRVADFVHRAANTGRDQQYQVHVRNTRSLTPPNEALPKNAEVNARSATMSNVEAEGSSATNMGHRTDY
jgi:hypothetical protein